MPFTVHTSNYSFPIRAGSSSGPESGFSDFILKNEDGYCKQFSSAFNLNNDILCDYAISTAYYAVYNKDSRDGVAGDVGS
jgi:hypothetical protein